MDDALSAVGAGRARLVDLAHVMEEGMPFWPTHPSFRHPLVESYTLGHLACHYALDMGEHSGTHFDAPIHFVPGGRSIDEVPLTQAFGRAVSIAATHLEPNGAVTPADLEAWEEDHGAIRSGDCVLFHFGWDRLWDGERDGRSFLADWPGLTGDAASALVERGVRMVACDTLSIDVFARASEGPAHLALLEAGVLIGENFNNLGALPPVCSLMAFPLPIKGGSGSPVRPVAVVEEGVAG